MSTYVCNSLSPYSKQRSMVESIDQNLRKNLWAVELSGLSPDQKARNKQAIVTNASNLLNEQRINGFNSWAFLFGVIGFHTGRIFQTKVLFHEMGKAAVTHTGIAVGVGVVSGMLIGQLFSYDMKLYSKWRQARRTIDRLQREVSSKH